MKKKKALKPVTKEKLEVLKRLIVASDDASDFCKRALIWLIDQTDGLTREVEMWVEDSIFRGEVLRGIHDMTSSLGRTKLHIHMHNGMFVAAWPGKYEGRRVNTKAAGCVLQIAPHLCDGVENSIELAREEIQAVEL